MSVPCVRVAREAGERVRSALDDAGRLDRGHEIVTDNGVIYIPVTDPGGLDWPIVERDPPTREQRTAPSDTLDFDPTYERLGDLILMEEPADRAARAADAFQDAEMPARAVLNRASAVQGQERVRDWDVVATVDDEGPDGFSPTETIHREYGHAFHVDVARAYFSPRLATERRRVVDDVAAEERIVDMFAGVGPFAIPMAATGAEVVASDLNPDAVALLRENADRNDVADRVTAIEGDARDLVDGYAGWADRIVMNLPHDADAFLETAIALAGDTTTIHYYDIQSDDDPYGPGERAIRDAAGRGYEVTIRERRTVRSYAPHAVNVCLDAHLVRNG